MTTNIDALILAPFGAVAITVRHDQLALELMAAPASDHVQVAKTSANPLVANACRQIVHYLQHPASQFELPLVQPGTPFQQRVWQAIVSIPLGEVRTYGELAHSLGSGPRAVANACGANKLPLLVPCHRVVAKQGLGGFMQGKDYGLQIKRWLLQHEGHKMLGVAGECA